MKRKIIYFLLALAVVMPASAQKFFKDAISLSDVSLWQQGNSLYVDMKIDMKNLTVSPERMLTLTPLHFLRMRGKMQQPDRFSLFQPQI